MAGSYFYSSSIIPPQYKQFPRLAEPRRPHLLQTLLAGVIRPSFFPIDLGFQHLHCFADSLRRPFCSSFRSIGF